MAVARWRRMRIRGMEKAGIDYEMRRQSDTSNPISTEDVATRASFAFRALCDSSRTLDLINRYDSRYQREYLRAHRRFLEVRDRRTPPPTPAAPEDEISKGTPEVIANKPSPAPDPGHAATSRVPPAPASLESGIEVRKSRQPDGASPGIRVLDNIGA